MGFENVHRYFTYGLLLCVAVLCISNYYKSQENSLLLQQLQNIQQDHTERKRRSADVVLQGKNNSDITDTVKKVLLSIPIQDFCKNIASSCQSASASKSIGSNAKDGERGPPGPPGPPGPRGPRGKPGKRGLGLYAPEFRESKLHLTLNKSSSGVFECKFFGNPIPNVQWSSSAHSTDIKSSIDKNESTITSYLSVKSVIWEDRGDVRCTASTFLGNLTKTGVLNILSAPKVNLLHGPLYVNLGVDIEFPECEVQAYPPANITWNRVYWGLPKKRATTDGPFLNISRVHTSDEGFYICTAKNSLGQEMRSIQLKTKPLEFKERPPYVVDVIANITTTLTCSAYGFPEQMTGGFYDIYGNIIPFNKSTTEDLFIVTTDVTDSGRYRCVIQMGSQKIEFVTMVEVFNLNSVILNHTNIVDIAMWLKRSNGFGQYDICWRSSTHGNSPSTFHNRCDGKPNTIFILSSYNGYVVGGYTDVPWSSYSFSSMSYHSSNHTFIFDLMTSTKYPTKNNGYNAVCHYSSYGPCFGEAELYTSTYALANLKNGRQYRYQGRTFSQRYFNNAEVFYKV